MKYLLWSLLLICSCKEKEKKNTVFKAQKDSLKTEKPLISATENEDFDILRFLLDEEIGNEKPTKLDYKNYTVSFDNDGDAYSVSFNKIASEDLDKDGIQDYIVEVNSEGMLGGNANTNSEIMYIIMAAHSKIKAKHEILKYAPFSYNILDNISYKNGVLKANASQNYRAYSKPMDEVESTELTFIYQNENVYEKSYLSDCELAKWKNKKVLTHVSESHTSIEMHNYTEVLKEKYVDKDFECEVELSGCDNLAMVIEGTYRTKDFSKKSVDEKRRDFLDFLVKNTTLSKDFLVVQLHFKDDGSSKGFVSQGNLSFNLFTNKEKDAVNFRLVLDKNENPNQTENWEITTRKK